MQSSPPRLAVVRGHGKCHVVQYRGHGYFLVKKSDDTKIVVRRSRIRFIKPKQAA